MKQKLDRTLGLFSSVTISVGTMIGSAIFVLAGTSYQTTGPAASLAIFLSGIAAMLTGFSFAELVTIIPKAGGGYAYVREATNNGIVGFICGWGFWLGYAMSCGLFALGFGNFINYFFPFIPQMLGAYLLVVYVTYTNIKGVKNSGKLQNIITTGLIVLLLGYIIIGIFNIDLDNQRPFFTNGFGGMFSAMGFLYMTYIGYGLITTASEEVINPEKTIPKAIIISIVFVIFLKTAVFFIGSGVTHWSELIPNITNTPLTDTAVKMIGVVGGYLFALAGILATLSSINTAIMASSRTSFALSRDQRLPRIFKVINGSTKTPIFSIVTTGFIVILSISIRNLEHISTVTSIFSLTGYSLVNVALIIFRKRKPGIKREFKVPLYPATPILGILINLFLIFQLALSDLLALIISVGIILLGIFYYYFIIPKLKHAPKGISPMDIPVLAEGVKGLNNSKREIIVPVSNPNTMDDLLSFGKKVAEFENNTEIVPVHIINIPKNVLVSADYDLLIEATKSQNLMVRKLRDYEKETKSVNPVIVQSRDITHGIISVIKEAKNPFVLIGWHESGFAKNFGGTMFKILEKAPADVCILKSVDSKKEYKKILFPYGGGKYSQMAAVIVNRLANVFDAEVTLLNINEDNKDEEESVKLLNESVSKFERKVKLKTVEGNLVKNVIDLSEEYDLVIMGAALNWGLNDYITGIRTDTIVEKSKCSVLIVKSFHSMLRFRKTRKLIDKLKKIIDG